MEADAGDSDLTVLVVEDYDSARKAFCLIVRSCGAAALGASNGEEALRLAAASRPDVVFCDIRLPGGIDGFQVLERLHAIHDLRDVPVIAMSGVGSSVELEQVVAAGFDAHLMKPVTSDVIEAHLRRIRDRIANL